MISIKNGTILKGINLTASKEDILIDDGKIIEISKDISEGEIIDAEGCIICPSFLNAHTHIGDSIIKDEAYGLHIDEVVKPPNGIKHRALLNADEEDIIYSMRDSMWEMLKSGTTHFIDYREGGLAGIKLLKKASKGIPINPIILGRDDSFYDDDPDLKKVKIAIRKILKISDGIAPSGFGEISDEVAILISEECRKLGKISSIHVGETKEAQFKSINSSNKTEVQRAIECNFNQLVHCTNPLNNDISLISNSTSNLVVCPRSNATLASGVTPLHKILNCNIRPLIGTDNVMLNSLSMFSELEFTMKLIVACFKKYLNPRDILKLATVNVLESQINSNISKSIIETDNFAELIILKASSKNPYLSIINRCQAKDIIYTINKNIIDYI